MSTPTSGRCVPEIRISGGCALKAQYNFAGGTGLGRYFSGIVGVQKDVYTLTEVRICLKVLCFMFICRCLQLSGVWFEVGVFLIRGTRV